MRLETLKSTVGRVAVGTAAAGLLVFGAATLTATAAAADTVLQLNSSATAPPGDDCPDDGAAYWHFVVTPNNGKITFEEIDLNLGDQTYQATGDLIVPNGSQEDNVFVAVPAGYTLTSLVKSGTSATVSGGVTDNSKFNLSHVCEGTTPTTPTTAPPTTPTTPTTQATTTSVLGNSTVPPSTPNSQAVVAAAEVAGVQQLPYTGSNTTPLALAGAGVLAGGAALAYAARRRQEA